MENIALTKNKNKTWNLKHPMNQSQFDMYLRFVPSRFGLRRGRRPKFQEVTKRRQGHVDAVEQGVSQEEDEELVVHKCHAVVDPGTVMVHLKFNHHCMFIESLDLIQVEWHNLFGRKKRDQN